MVYPAPHSEHLNQPKNTYPGVRPVAASFTLRPALTRDPTICARSRCRAFTRCHSSSDTMRSDSSVFSIHSLFGLATARRRDESAADLIQRERFQIPTPR